MDGPANPLLSHSYFFLLNGMTVMKTLQQTNDRRKAFTLMEILLVLAILGVIMAMVAPRLMGRQQHASADATRISIVGLSQALKLYALDHSGEFPATGAGIQVLMKNPGNDKRWRGPYLEKPARDAWGNEFEYQFPGRKNADSFDVVSPGPDRVMGTSDDIGNWDV